MRVDGGVVVVVVAVVVGASVHGEFTQKLSTEHWSLPTNGIISYFHFILLTFWMGRTFHYKTSRQVVWDYRTKQFKTNTLYLI